MLTTNLLVLLTWLFFRSQDFTTAFYYLQHITVQWSASTLTVRCVLIMLTYVATSTTLDVWEYVTRDHTFLLRVAAPARYATAGAMWLLCLLFMFQAEALPFIYFQF